MFLWGPIWPSDGAIPKKSLSLPWKEITKEFRQFICNFQNLMQYTVIDIET